MKGELGKTLTNCLLLISEGALAAGDRVQEALRGEGGGVSPRPRGARAEASDIGLWLVQ